MTKIYAILSYESFNNGFKLKKHMFYPSVAGFIHLLLFIYLFFANLHLQILRLVV